MKVWLNGELVDERKACIWPSDRGFLLGDGVFETLRSYSGRIFGLREHLDRMESGARAIGLSIPSVEAIAAAAESLIEVNGLPDARIRVTVTSGPGPPDLDRGQAAPTTLVTASPFRAWPEVATAVVSSSTHDEASPLAGVKTTSRAESVLALRQARAAGADEALFGNRAGNVCEATTANIFVVRQGVVVTPPLEAGCLAGITRDHVLRLCAQIGVEAGEENLSLAELHDVDEAFLTSSTREIQPLVRLDTGPVDTGRPGPTTLRLAEAFVELVRSQA